MPTENLSSNTEMAGELLPCPFCGDQPQITKHHREEIYSFMHRCQVLGPISWGFREDQQAHVEKWNARVQPAPQPHPEPIAWMVGTAFWWTKEEAERDAAATGLPMMPVGPITESGKPTVQHQGEPVAWVRFRNGEPDYDGDACMIMNVAGDTLGDGDSWEPVYTHADPGEVGRLRDSAATVREVHTQQTVQLNKAMRSLGERAREGDDLRAQLNIARAALANIMHATDDSQEDGAHHENAYSLADHALNKMRAACQHPNVVPRSTITDGKLLGHFCKDCGAQCAGVEPEEKS